MFRLVWCFSHENLFSIRVPKISPVCSKHVFIFAVVVIHCSEVVCALRMMLNCGAQTFILNSSKVFHQTSVEVMLQCVNLTPPSTPSVVETNWLNHDTAFLILDESFFIVPMSCDPAG